MGKNPAAVRISRSSGRARNARDSLTTARSSTRHQCLILPVDPVHLSRVKTYLNEVSIVFFSFFIRSFADGPPKMHHRSRELTKIKEPTDLRNNKRNSDCSPSPPDSPFANHDSDDLMDSDPEDVVLDLVGISADRNRPIFHATKSHANKVAYTAKQPEIGL